MSSSQSATTEELESVRFELFREAGYADNLDFNNPIFKKLSYELSKPEQLRFPKYLKKLASAERQLAETQKQLAETQKQLEMEKIRDGDLSELFPKLHFSYHELLKMLPSKILRPDSVYSEDDFIAHLKSACDEPRIKAFYSAFDYEKRKLKLKAEKDEVEKGNSDDTPVQEEEDNMIIAKNGGNTIFYPFENIYIRDCYKKLYNLAIDSCKSSSVAIIGDPGIGKTTLIRYIFHLLVTKKYKDKEKGFRVYWAFESGMWRYFDGENTPITGSGKNEFWKADDVILLVDGSYQEAFMPKFKNMILFCSPERSNYSKMIKIHQGRVFVMPPWSYKEVEELFNLKQANRSDQILGYKLFEKFYDEIVNDAQKSNEFPENVSSEVCDYISKNPPDKKGLLLSWLKARYNLVGGRIRLLLDNNLRYEDLEERVENAVLCVSPNKLSRVNVLDYFSNVPSIIYSLIPDEKTNFRRYSTRFASDSIRDLVSANIITGKNEDFKNIFGAMKNHNIAGALMGQIFESAILKFISHKLTAKLTCRKSVSGNNMNLENDNLEMSNFETVYYDAAKPGDVKEKIINGKSEKNLFFIPQQSNAAQVDSIYYNLGEGKLYFFQITTSSHHSFRFHVISKLADDIGFKAGDVNFVFIVPESIFQTFPYHNYTTKSDTVYQNQNKLKSQIVAYFANMEEIENYFVDSLLRNTARVDLGLPEAESDSNIDDKQPAVVNGNGIEEAGEIEKEQDDSKQPSKKRTRKSKSEKS